MANDVIMVNNLKAAFDELIAVNDASFTAKHRGVSGFLDLNGAAKPTRSIASKLNKNETKKRGLG
jgi:ABC-type uncharacterized transport system ATPase subunit